MCRFVSLNELTMPLTDLIESAHLELAHLKQAYDIIDNNTGDRVTTHHIRTQIANTIVELQQLIDKWEIELANEQTDEPREREYEPEDEWY